MRMATFKWIRPADLPMLRLCGGVSGRGAWAGQCLQTSPASKDKRGKDVDGRSRLLVGTNNILFQAERKKRQNDMHTDRQANTESKRKRKEQTPISSG